jgi:hypothetical protein
MKKLHKREGKAVQTGEGPKSNLKATVKQMHFF